MPKVDSSAIAEVDYDRPSADLLVTFHGTGTYAYLGVPERMYHEMLEAPSVGRYFNDNIKDQYAFVRRSRRRR